MGNGIVHIEDLAIQDFIDTIRNISKFKASEKLDGSELIFGLDSRGNFYTSREAKNGQRYYSANEYSNGFWTVGFRSAHIALEGILSTIKQHFKAGDSAEIEVLFGSQPNTIPYGADTNYIAFIRSMSGSPDILSLAEDVNNHEMKTSLNVPYTTDGVHVDFRDETHRWKFVPVPVLEKEQLEKIANNKNINEKLDKLEKFLGQESGIHNFTNLEILAIKLNTRPKRIDQTDWKTAKEVIKQKRERILKHIMSYKLKIKNDLLNALVRSTSSKLGPSVENGGWIEGIVLKNNNSQVKLVDKKIFTELNIFLHKVRKEIQEDIWLKFKMEVADTLGHPQLFGSGKSKYIANTHIQFDDITKKKNIISGLARQYMSKLEVALKDYIDKRNLLVHEVEFTDRKQVFDYSNDIHKHTLQAFASTKNRISDMRLAILNATTDSEILDAYLERESVSKPLKEGGNIFTDTKRIDRKDIPSTISYISKILGIPVKDLADNVLGSVGKSATSGDIDIAIDSNKYSLDSLEIKALEHLPDNKVSYSTGLKILHLEVPIAGNTNNGYVQVDLMLTDSLEWAKFNYFSAGDASKYKGLYRRYLLSSIAGSTNDVEHDENGELIRREGWVWIPSIGLQKQVRYRPIGKEGRRLKTFKVERSNIVVNDPKKVIDILFGQAVDPKALETVESLVSVVKQTKSEKEQKLIFAIYKKSLESAGYKFPIELI